MKVDRSLNESHSLSGSLSLLLSLCLSACSTIRRGLQVLAGQRWVRTTVSSWLLLSAFLDPTQQRPPPPIRTANVEASLDHSWNSIIY